jgi:hypothetical protein
MMRAKLKGIHSPDADLRSFIPADAGCFCLLVQIMAGPDDGPGQESFDLTLCTPKWLLAEYSAQDVVPGRHMLLVFEYDFERIFSYLKSQVENAAGDDWRAVARQLSRIGKWEFEDYKHTAQST